MDRHFLLLACICLLSCPSRAGDTDSENTVDADSEATTVAEIEEVVTTSEKPVAEIAQVVTTTAKPGRRRACTCSDGRCTCCSGAILQSFNIPFNQKICAEVLYEPEDFTFNFRINFNGRELYKNKISGKNPRPICLPLSRYLPVDMCVKFSNIYMIGRNLHACLEMHGEFLEAEIFDISFDCFRIGMNGLAFVKPEDGGGLPIQLPEKPVSQDKLDYDDSA